MRTFIVTTLTLLLLSACARYHPPTEFPETFRDRATTKTTGGLTISAVVLSSEEEQQVFATKLSKHSIQPVWLKIDNATANEYALMLPSLDRNYFSPAEAAWKSRGLWERGFNEKIGYFFEQHIPVRIRANATSTGFFFANFDPGAKVVSVELIGDRDVQRTRFILEVPGFEADFFTSKPAQRYSDKEITELDLAALRTYLEDLPCCALGGDRKTPGDPLNLVVIGDGETVLSTFIRQGWDLTEPARFATAWNTFWSSLFSSRYRTSPVSALYLFDRPQDAALQKSRQSVDERNHLRLWRAPVNYQGQPVWVGQISRDIGVKLSSKTVVTHKIDPVVDEARLYVMMDLLSSHTVKSFGLVKGVGLSPLDNPRHNYTLDPYVTDGLRVMMVLDPAEIDYTEMQWLDWEKLLPPIKSWAAPAPVTTEETNRVSEEGTP